MTLGRRKQQGITSTAPLRDDAGNPVGRALACTRAHTARRPEAWQAFGGVASARIQPGRTPKTQVTANIQPDSRQPATPPVTRPLPCPPTAPPREGMPPATNHGHVACSSDFLKNPSSLSIVLKTFEGTKPKIFATMNSVSLMNRTASS